MANESKGQLRQSNIVFFCDFVYQLGIGVGKKNGQSRKTELAFVCCLLFHSPIALSALIVVSRCIFVI